MIVLDTHAWVWWLSSPDQLSERARKTIDVASAAGTAHVSAISCTSAEVTQALEEYAELLRRMGRFEEAGALAARIVSGGG